MSNEELVSLSAVELRRRIGTKEISPVELLEACLDRIEEVNPAVNAVTAMAVKRARKEAKAAETAARRGEDLPLLHESLGENIRFGRRDATAARRPQADCGGNGTRRCDPIRGNSASFSRTGPATRSHEWTQFRSDSGGYHS